VDASIDVRDSIRRQFRNAPDSALQQRIVTAALAVGDTAAAVEFLSENMYRRPRVAITVEHYRLLRRQLLDPATALRAGVNRELLALTLIDGLVHAPPVLASRTQVAAICAPAACRAMARDATMQNASPALRAVALVAAMVTTPSGWTDSVIANARTNPLLAGRALWFARGASSNAVASAKAPIPDASASEATWRFWLSGQDSAYTRVQATIRSAMVTQAVPSARARPIIVSEMGATAIRFAEQRTGQSYASAFRARRAATVDDSTRALYTALLFATGDSVFTSNDLKTIVLGPSSDERRIAIQRITERRVGTLIVAPDSIATDIGTRVIESLYGGTRLTFVADASTSRSFFAAPPDVDSIPRFLSMDSLPLATRQRATALGRAPMPLGWSFVAGTTGTTTRISAVRRSGPFYSIAVAYTTLHARGDRRSGGYASGFTLWFVEAPQGWAVFAAAAWIT